MSLNIKNERVHELARTAARRTGKSQTSVIEQALEELLARMDDGAEDRARRDRIDRILANFDERLAGGPPLSTDGLYDELGLPQ